MFTCLRKFGIEFHMRIFLDLSHMFDVKLFIEPSASSSKVGAAALQRERKKNISAFVFPGQIGKWVKRKILHHSAGICATAVKLLIALFLSFATKR